MTDTIVARTGRLAPGYGYLLAGLPLGIAAFPVAVAGFAAGVGTLVVGIGVPVLVATRWRSTSARSSPSSTCPRPPTTTAACRPVLRWLGV